MKIPIIFSVFISIIVLGCNTNSIKSNSDKTKEIGIDINKGFQGLRIKKIFNKNFPVYNFSTINPYENGVMLWRSQGGRGFLDCFNFNGVELFKNKEFKFDRQAPDKLSYGALVYDYENNELWNILTPFAKIFNIKNLKTFVKFKLQSSSGMLNSGKYLIPRPLAYAYKNQYIWTFNDLAAKDWDYTYGICKISKDFSTLKSIYTFSKPYEKWYRAGVKKRVREITGYSEVIHDKFPFTVDTKRGKIYFSSDIWRPEFYLIDSNGVVIKYFLKTHQSLFSDKNLKELDIYIEYYKSLLPPPSLRNVYKYKKSKTKYNPYIFDILVYKDLILVVTPSFCKDKLEKILYVLDAESLKFLGISSIPATGKVRDYFIVNDFLIESSYIIYNDEVHNNITVYEIEVTFKSKG